MYRWYGLAEVPSDWGACVVTIGVFDGVHRGHQRDVRRAAEIARARNLPVVVVTFDPHPDEVVRPGSHRPSSPPGAGRRNCLPTSAPTPCACSRSTWSSPG